jgi:hypothetical protein
MRSEPAAPGAGPPIATPFRYTADIPACVAGTFVAEPRSPAELLAYPLRVEVTATGRIVYGCSRVSLIMEGVPRWVRLPWVATVTTTANTPKVKADPASPLFATLKAREMTMPPDVRDAIRTCALGAMPRARDAIRREALGLRIEEMAEDEDGWTNPWGPSVVGGRAGVPG